VSLLRKRTPSRRRFSPFAAGLIAIAVIALPVYVAFGGRLPWQTDHEVRAVVRSANELQSRSPVRIAGVEVGKVKSIERGPGSTAIVTMAINDNGLPLYKDATLKVRPRLFLEGNFFIDLRPGTPGADELPEGGTIPLSQTATPVQLDQVLTALNADTRKDLVMFLHGFSQLVDKGGAKRLNRLVPLMEPALLDTAVTTQALHGRRPGDLAGFIGGGEQTARALASRRAELPRLVGALDTTLTTLAQRRAEVGDSLVALDSVVGHAPATFAALNHLFPTLRAAAIEARPGLRAAPATLNLANPLLEQAGGLISRPELPALLDQVDPTVTTLYALEPRLTRLLSKVRPITQCVRRNAIPTLKSSVVDPPLTTGLPIYRELLDGAIGLASGSQDFTGDGPAVRYHAGFGETMVTTGQLPGLNETLVGLTSEPLIGSRPRYTGVRPPFRPDVPCESQDPPKLDAETGPAPAQRKVSFP
jgi:phospholipid/cholesterol/gamma-HCH transport system substrate-binding protein